MFNPGGPGASGHERGAVAVGTGSAPTARSAKRFDVVGFDPRGVGASTPDDRLPHRRASGRSSGATSTSTPPRPGSPRPRRRTGSTRSGARSAPAAPTCWPTSAPATPPATSTSCAPRSATRSSPTSATPTAPGSARPTPRSSRRTSARWCSTARWTPRQSAVDRYVAQAAGFQQAFDAFAADCAKQPDCPLGSGPGPGDRRLPGARSRPLIDQAARGRRPHARPTPTRSPAVTQALYVSWAWPALAQAPRRAAPRRRHGPAAARRPLPRAGRRRQLRQHDEAFT